MIYKGNVTSWQQWLKLAKQGYTEVSGDFYCSNNQLTSLEGAPQTVGGSFYCYNNQLTSLEGVPQTVGGSFGCSNNQLTSLEGAPQTVGGSFGCSNNQLTSLEGAPQTVGGRFDCYNNQLTSLEGAPRQHADMFETFLGKGYVFLDGILTKSISIRTKDGVNIYRTQKLYNVDIIYVAREGLTAAHGRTIKEALEELRFKTASKDVEQYRGMAKTTKHTPKEWAVIYRAITGACKWGTENFIAGKGNLKKHYTLSEILTQTDGSFGHDKFKEVVGG